MADTGFTRRDPQNGRELQPIAIASVDPANRTAEGITRQRTVIRINCAYATGDTITVPAVGEQWYVERFLGEWRLYGRIPFNDATLNIEPIEGQVSVGSAVGPLELNGSEVRANGLFRLTNYYYRDNGKTLQRSPDGIHWTSIYAIAENSNEIIAVASSAAAAKISDALTDPLNTDPDLEGFINGLDGLITNVIDSSTKFQNLYTRITSAQDRADEAFANALDAMLANKFADLLVEWKARAGSNLVLDGKFNDSTLKRFPLNDTQFSGYALGEEHHSGIQSWVWDQFPGIECGFKMAPTERINHFDVSPGEVYFVETWIFPNILNTITAGSIRIGGTLSDSSEILPDSYIYLDYPQNGPDVVPGQWNKINITITIPDMVIDPGTSEKVGHDKIVFWVKTTANTIGGNQYWIDDVVVRENTFADKAKRQADLANFIVNLKAWAGSNLVIDPKFSNTLVKRFPYNDDEVYEYSTEQKKSAFHSWKWTQETNAACGLVLAPTQDVENIQVNGGEKYTIEANIFPKTGNSGLGEVRIGATFTDLQGVALPTDRYTAYDFATMVVPNAWATINAEIEVPGGYELAKFWVIVTEGAAAGDVFYVDNVTLRESTASVRAQAAADFAEALVDAKARAGGNLVIDPKFSSSAIPRFSYAGDEVHSYSTAQKHSGFQSWSWTQKAGAASGFVMNPTAKISTYQVSKDDNYIVSAWVYPTVSSGALRIGATLTDATGINPPIDIFDEYLLPAGAPSGSWTQLSAPVVVPTGYDTAKFWIIATSTTPADSVFYVDDVNIRDNTTAAATTAQSNLANAVVNAKAKAGSNLVIDPTFSNILLDRFAYNPNQISVYTTDQKHSGLTSWSWTQSVSIACGFVFSPTTSVDTFQVAREDNFAVSCWIHPKATNTPSGTLRIGATLIDTSGLLPSIETYTDYPLNSAVPPGQWTQVGTAVVVPSGYDNAKFWVAALSDTPSGSIFYIDDANLRDNSAVAATDAQVKITDMVVDLKAKAGANLVLDPKFSNILVSRFPYYLNQEDGYSTISEPRHSGLVSWRWKQWVGQDCGLVLQPSIKVDSYQVDPGDQYVISAWVYPKDTNSVASPTIRIGAIFSDPSGVLGDIPSNISSTITRGQWNQIGTILTVPADRREAKFYVVTPSTTPADEIFFIDDVEIKEVTHSQTVVDNINTAVNGTTTTGNGLPTVVTNLKSAWAKFVDGLKGHPSGTTTTALPADVFAAATDIKVATDTVTEVVAVQAKDYSNIAAGSDFETWTPDTILTDAIYDGHCVHPWELDSGWSEWTSHIYWGPGGYMGDPPVGEDFTVSPFGHSLACFPDTVVRYATLKNKPNVQYGEQFYIEFWALRDQDYNGTNTLSRLRVGYNDDDIFLDSIPYGTSTFTETLTWRKFSKTITVPVGAEYLTFSLGCNSNYTNSSVVSRVGMDGAPHDINPGQAGKIWIDNIVIRRLVPPEGVELLPIEKVNALNTNMAALSAYRGASIWQNGDFEASSFTVINDFGPGGPPENRYMDMGPGVNATYVTEYNHSGTQSIKLEASTLGWARISMPLDPLGTGPTFIPCVADGSDVFYAEAWVRGSASNTYPSGLGGVSIQLWPKELNVLDPSHYFGSVVGCVSVSDNVQSACHGAWTKISGIFSPPSGLTGFYLAVEGSGLNNVWWADDFNCFRITESAVAQVQAGAAATVASSATTNLQTTVDSVVQAVDGTTDVGAAHATTKTKLQLAFAKIFDGLNGSWGSTIKTPAEIQSAAASVKSSASTAESVAGAASTTAGEAATAAAGAVIANENTNKAVYNGFFGSGGSGSTTQVSDTIAAIKQKIANGWTVQTITVSQTWTRPWTPGDPTAPTEFWVICVGSGSGGGKGVANASLDGSTRIGGEGGSGGRWLAKQVDPAAVTSTVSATIAAAGAGQNSGNGYASPNNLANTSFGSYVATTSAISASIASFLGYYSCADSKPGNGGAGGSNGSHNGVTGDPTPLAAGGTGATSDGAAGSTGGTASVTDATRAGGGGGGGGAYAPAGTPYGGNGGNGGWPGGGGGGGGAALGVSGVGGDGGYGAAGAVILLWK